MRKLLLIAFLLQSAFALSQPYGNEWVNASQPHFKFKINPSTIELTQLNVIMSTFKGNQNDSEVNCVPIEYVEI